MTEETNEDIIGSYLPKNGGVLGKIKQFRIEVGKHNIPKSGKNTFQNYEYYTESDIFGVVNPILERMGLLPNYQITASAVDTFDKGYRIRATGIMTLVDLDMGDQFTFGPILADGSDNADKAAYKVNTGFVRTIWCKFLGLSNKDEPENEPVQRAPARVPNVKVIVPPSDTAEEASMTPQQKAIQPWNKDNVYAKASKAGKLAAAQKLKMEGKTWDEIAGELAL